MVDRKEAALYEAKRQKLLELERQKNLPHLYGFPWYDWAREFFENTKDKTQLLTAANQISKSSTQIRKCIHWATEKALWPRLWNNDPVQLWYLYPDSQLACAEFETKWTPEFMPRNSMKDDPKYGWDIVYKKKGVLDYIMFNSGVRVYFKTYTQDVHSLQAGTVHAIFCDEELPEDLYSELSFRLTATNGYFHMVFTATRAQEFWREAMEEIGTSFERFRGAWKRSVSMYDCLQYEDGSASPWTVERIELKKLECKDDNEIQRRIYGRFIRSDNRRYVFDKRRNYVRPGTEDWVDKPPKDWHVFAGVDIGSGGKEAAPGAIIFVAVRPDFCFGRVFRAWRGDGIITTAGDIFNRYMEMKADIHVLSGKYDYGSADFGNIAMRNAEPFGKADKSRHKGDEILNTLLKYGMLQVDDTGDFELEKLCGELTNLGKDCTEGDDLSDAGRYCVIDIPWDFTFINKLKELAEKKIDKMSQLDQRRGGHVVDQRVEVLDGPDAEMQEWSELMG